MHRLEFFLTRSVWMLSGAALFLLLLSLGLLLYSTWRYVERIEPIQLHLQYLTRIEIAESDVRTQLINLLASETGYLNPAELNTLRKQINDLRTIDMQLAAATSSALAYAHKQLTAFDGKSQYLLDEALFALRGALNQELAAHQAMVGMFQTEAQRGQRIAIGLAIGLLVISALLWAMVRQRILNPLNKLTAQMSLLSRRDYSELPIEDADPLLYPILEKYNRMAQRLRKLEQTQNKRQETLTQEVRNATYMLLQQQKRLSQAERLGAVGEMAAGIAHELRNPLTSVQMALENLRHDVPEPEIVARVDMITDEVKRVTRQLNQLLDQSRQRPERPVKVNIAEELENLASLVAYQLHENISVHFESEEDLVCLLPRSRLRQALLNLILNAGQILNETKGDIMLQAHREGTKLKLMVSDTGPGFPQAILEGGAQSFRSWRTGGTGLGLVMVSRFTSDLGGELLLSNRAQGGACVTLLLPCE